MKKKTEKAKKEVAQEPVEPSKESAKAVARYLRIAPRKMRIVIDTIRFESTYKAFQHLAVMNKKAAVLTEKLLKSAVANAKDIGLDESRLYISKIFADGGPSMKRFMPRSMGRADRILKRTTHLSIELKEGQKKWPTASPDLGVKEEQEGSGKSEKKKSTKKKKAKAAA